MEATHLTRLSGRDREVPAPLLSCRGQPSALLGIGFKPEILGPCERPYQSIAASAAIHVHQRTSHQLFEHSRRLLFHPRSLAHRAGVRPDRTAVLYNPRILATAPLACGARSFSLMAKHKVATAGSPARANSEYIVGAAYDCTLFLLPPTFALCLGILISDSGFANTDFRFYDHDVTWAGLLIGIIIHAHLFAVFFRSHGNGAIRSLHPFRFLLVPVVLYLAMVSSVWVLISVSVLATFWDVYHSALQTFGFARICQPSRGSDS